MSDLIDREELISRIILANNRSSLGETVSGFNLSGIGVVGVIKDMEIAYDVDKVIEKLEKEKYIIGVNATIDHATTSDYIEAFNDSINNSINIVKGGVIDEIN